MIPHWENAASYAESEPAIVPVWEETASDPLEVLPDFITRTGFLREAFLLASIKPGPSTIPSRYAVITSVFSSSIKSFIQSFSLITALFPRLTILEKPIFFLSA